MKESKAHDGKIPIMTGLPEDCPQVEDCGVRQLERLSTAFMASAKRWEMIVYPSLFAFIILAGYGFFLIYSLSRDAHEISEQMITMTRQMESISQNMVIIAQTMDGQTATMKEMAVNMRGMNASMNQMRYDMSIMNQNVSRPMSFMNSFMPW